MGYQESLLYIEPQWKFEKLIRTYEKAEQAGYYRVAGAEPRSVVVLKQPLGNIPAGKRLLWVCGDRGFHSVGGVFGGEWKSRARVRVIPVEEVLRPDDYRLEGIDLDSAAPSENAYMRRYSVENYAHRMRAGLARYHYTFGNTEVCIMTKEMMEEKLYQRMQEENRQFLAELREQTADDIIAHAYEIACRDNFLMLFEDETGLTPQQLNALLRFEHPLAELYNDWIKRETSEMDNFRSSIECCANDAIRREKERRAQKKNVPAR